MSRSEITRQGSDEVSAFVEQLRKLPRPASGEGAGRLIFALDATASREGADFAEEAAYGGGEHADPSQRPEAPRLRHEHVWGVRDDWGERAKTWGRGAGAYAPNQRERGDPS